jgi:hypothetical protein
MCGAINNATGIAQPGSRRCDGVILAQPLPRELPASYVWRIEADGQLPGECQRAKGRGVTLRRFVLVVGAVALVVGIIGLLVPVSVSDGNGGSMGCGNAAISDLSSAREANNKSVANIPILNQIVPHTDFVAQCQSALSSRRSWTIPVTVIGAIAVIGAFFVRGGRSPGSRGF